MNVNDYTFKGLRSPMGEPDHDPRSASPSLCYLIGLAASPKHEITDVIVAKRIISWLYGCEEQAGNAEHLRVGETFFNRYFTIGYHPQTPCMVVNHWSPISAMIERGFKPETLNREVKFRAVATGIWSPLAIDACSKIESAKNIEELFWAIIGEVSRRAKERKMWLSIVAQPGWSYSSAIKSLPDWPAEEVERSGRVLWKRTPEG